MLPTPNKNMQLPKIQILRYSQLLNSPFSDMKLLNLDASFVCFNNLTANVKFMNHQVYIEVILCTFFIPHCIFRISSSLENHS